MFHLSIVYKLRHRSDGERIGRQWIAGGCCTVDASVEVQESVGSASSIARQQLGVSRLIYKQFLVITNFRISSQIMTSSALGNDSLPHSHLEVCNSTELSFLIRGTRLNVSLYYSEVDLAHSV